MFEKELTADGYILADTDAVGCEVSIAYISWRGVTAGDRVALRDTGPTGSVRFEFTMATADGFARIPFREDFRDLKLAGRGYYTELKTGGTIRTFLRG